MKLDADDLRVHSLPELHDYFYSKDVRSSLGRMQDFLVKNHELHLFPEATIKKNKMPNGIMVKSLASETMLMPSLLRDPGCGFLLFQIEKNKTLDLASLASHTLSFCTQLEKSIPRVRHSLKEILCSGVRDLPAAQLPFTNSFFPVDTDYLFLDLDLGCLLSDINQITNSLEIKCSINEEEPLVGFIHSGSELFPKLIHEQWFNSAADYTYNQGHATINAINEGYYGFPATLEEALEYQQSLFAAMNYCLFKRWFIFEQFKQYMEERFSLTIQMLNDRCHAGLFVEKDNTLTYLLQSRGVQRLNNEHPSVIAGQKESISYLVHPLRQDRIHYVGHGTSYRTSASYNYSTLLGVEQAAYFLEKLALLRANTRINREHCLAYNFNAQAQMQYLEKEGLQLSLLLPCVNYQGAYLRKVEQ